MLIIEPKVNEKIILTDKDSGNVTTIIMFRRWPGIINFGFDAPRTVKITREKRQRTVEDGKES